MIVIDHLKDKYATIATLLSLFGCYALWPSLGTLRNTPSRANWFDVDVRKFSEHPHWQGTLQFGRQFLQFRCFQPFNSMVHYNSQGLRTSHQHGSSWSWCSLYKYSVVQAILKFYNPESVCIHAKTHRSWRIFVFTKKCLKNWSGNLLSKAVWEASHPVHTPGSCEDWKVPAHCSISSRI